jgi:hypothetical protein
MNGVSVEAAVPQSKLWDVSLKAAVHQSKIRDDRKRLRRLPVHASPSTAKTACAPEPSTEQASRRTRIQSGGEDEAGTGEWARQAYRFEEGRALLNRHPGAEVAGGERLEPLRFAGAVDGTGVVRVEPARRIKGGGRSEAGWPTKRSPKERSHPNQQDHVGLQISPGIRMSLFSRIDHQN